MTPSATTVTQMAQLYDQDVSYATAINTITTLVITAATDIGSMMMELAALSFLGFGAQPPTPEWGKMLNDGRTLIQTAPWTMIYPGLAIFITVVVFNMLGDALRDILDPKSE